MSSPQDTFVARRAALMERIGDGVAVIPSAPVAIRNRDVEHEYRQDSDFFYLTGFEEPGSVLVLSPRHKEHPFVLFVRPRDKTREVWDGPRAGIDGAKADFGADAAYELSELDKHLPGHIGTSSKLIYNVGRDQDFDRQIFKTLASVRSRWREGLESPTVIEELTTSLHEMRLIKSPGEIEACQRAADITAEAHIRAMGEAEPGGWEHQIDATLSEVFRRSGSKRAAYPHIVASGANATILHYVANDHQMQDGDLLLIDAGAEFDYYASDVTRTFPVNGRFTGPQRAVYDVVLTAQKASVAGCRAGRSFDDVHQTSLRLLCEGMLDIGLLEGDLDTVIEKETYKPYFMHKTSHWIGMDVHDVGNYKAGGEFRPLAPGHCLTVEPGIYIAADAEEAPERFRGIGVRIEDDILVTDGDPFVLTAAIPKDVDEVEAACRA
jgi:Xaa-Pro aminopeptidase